MSSTDKIRKVHSHYSKKLLHTAMIMDGFFCWFFLHTEMGRGDLRDIIDLDKWLYSVFWWCLMLFRDRWLFPILRPPLRFLCRTSLSPEPRTRCLEINVCIIIHNHFSKFLTMYSNLLLIKTANVWVEKGKACHIPLLI